MEVLHTAYERLIRWAFSTRRYRLFALPIPVFGRPFDANNQRDKTQQRRLRLATITPRGLVLMGGAASFVVAILLTPLVGSEFVPQTDQGFTQLTLRMPVATSLERGNDKVLQIEELLKAYPEIKTVSTVVGSTGEGLSTGRNQAALNISLTDERSAS